MRTSNKILLGSFITTTVILVGIHMSLYAKYKKGNFIDIVNTNAERFNLQILPGIKYVSATGLSDVNIIASDTLKIETEKNHPSQLRVSLEGETLVIRGDTVIRRNAFEDRQRAYSPVNLYLPSSIKVKIDFCEVELNGSPDSLSSKSYDFDLTETSMMIGDDTPEGTAKIPSRYWKQLDIKAGKHSSLKFFRNVKIAGMNLLMNESSIHDNNSDIGRLNLQTDDKSSINLSGATIKKINLTPKQ